MERELSYIDSLVRHLINVNDTKKCIQEKYLQIWQMTCGGITAYLPPRTTRGALLIVARIERQDICTSMNSAYIHVTNEMSHTFDISYISLAGVSSLVSTEWLK